MAFSNTLPGVYEAISDGNLNLVNGSAEQTVLKIGVCTSGVPNTVAAYGSQSVMTSALGAGALVDNLACQFAAGSSTVLAMSANPSQAGSVQATTHAGSGTARCDGYAATHESVIIFIKTGGALGTGTFEYNVNLDGYSSPVTLPAGGTYLVPGTYLTVSFGAGTYVANDVYVFNVDGTVVHNGSGTPVVGVSSASPIDNYYVSVNVLTGGAVGTAQVEIALDNQAFGAPQVTASTMVLAGAGIYLALSGTLVAGDNYSFLTCGPSFNNSDLVAALNAIPQNLQFSMLEVVRGAMLSSAALAATEAASVQSRLNALFGTGTSGRGVISCPSVNGSSVIAAQAGLMLGSVATSAGNLVVDSTDTDAAIKSAFANTSAARVSVAPGDFLQPSPLTGLSLRRPASWQESNRLAQIPASQDAGEVSLGGLPNCTLLFRDEALTPGLDISSGQMFTTLRTISQDPGFFFTNCLTFAGLNSDYVYMTNARVIDRAATLARSWALPLINKRVPTTRNPNAVQGSIDAGYAAQLNLSLSNTLSNEMVPSDCVAIKGQVDTNHNITADRILPITVSVQVYAYSAFIDITLGLAVQV